MDCPNCGVYNPEDRQICWRCDQELPKPTPSKKRASDPYEIRRRTWIIVAVAVVVWILLTWLVPMLFGGPATPGP